MEGKYTSSQQLALALLVLVASIGFIEGSVLNGWYRRSPQQQNQHSPSHQASAPVSVQTSSGILNGARQMLNIGTNNSIYKFLSVPYAEAPINQLRFRRPVELKDRSETVVDVSEFGKTCPQYRHLTRFISPLLNIDPEHQTSEDCLHLNIYVPSTVGTVVASESSNKLEPNKRLPVIVWIPGEGFDFADARQFDGSNLAHKTQSIVVTVQYRVGVLGFLHAPAMGIQGNMGIHDQLMALKWIQKNIIAFGGDSERVTLMGRFSGSMSISSMITAPNKELVKSNGKMLFNRVAMLSGVAVEDWIIDSQQAKRVSQLEGAALLKKYCNASSIRDQTCLQNMPVDQLLRIADYGWRLVIDNELIGQSSPIEAVKMNQFASELDGVLIGETGMEGTLCLYRHMLESRNNNYARLIEEDKMTTNDLYEIIRYDSNAYFGYNLTKSNPIQAALESMIEDSTDKSSNNNNAVEQENVSSSKLREKYLNACSSYMVKSHLNRFKRNIIARNQLTDNRMDSSKKPVEVFHYELRYKPTFSLAPDYIKTAAHGDDIPLIFGLIYNQPRREIDDADLLMTRKMMAYIGNFVHGNNPLLSQHSSIDSEQTDSMSKFNENETSSMDETETTGTGSSQNSNQGASGSGLASLIKRSWSSEGLVHAIEFNENDFDEIQSAASRSSNNNNNNIKGQNLSHENDTTSTNVNGPTFRVAGQHPNIRVILVESPQPLNSAAELKAQSIFDLVEQQRSNREVDEQQHSQYEPMNQAAKSQRLINIGRQQMLSDLNDLWTQNSRRNNHMIVPSQHLIQQQQLQLQLQQQQQQHQHQQQQPRTIPQPPMTLVNESSFMTMLVFSACIVIFALMSLCFGLCLVIFRNNLTANKEIQHFNTSSSTCNICDEAQGNSIDAVLTGNRKDGRGFSNVFAKLKNHSHHNSSQSQSTSANSTRQQTGGSANLVLHQRVESEANQRDQ